MKNYAVCGNLPEPGTVNCLQDCLVGKNTRIYIIRNTVDKIHQLATTFHPYNNIFCCHISVYIRSDSFACIVINTLYIRPWNEHVCLFYASFKGCN